MKHCESTRVIATHKQVCKDLEDMRQTYGGRLVLIQLDITCVESQREALNQLKTNGIDHIDVLVANAGILTREQSPYAAFRNTSVEDMMEVYRTDVIGTMLTVQTFMDLVLRSKHKLVVFMSAKYGSIELTGELSGFVPYRCAKAAQNMLGMAISADEEFKNTSAKVVCIDPGWVNTDMGRSSNKQPTVSVEESVQGISSIICAAACREEGESNVAKKALSGIANMVEKTADKVSEMTHIPSIIPSENTKALKAKLVKDNCVFVDYKGQILAW